MAEKSRPAIALTIAGSDSSGGAGIQADLKTFTALGVYGASVITALTAQNTRGVWGVAAVDPEFIGAQLTAVADDLRINAVKTGMLGDRATVRAVVAGLKRHDLGPIVVDPVMVATSGDVLLAPDAIDAVRSELVPLATLITPNLHEAAQLLGRAVARDTAEMERQALALCTLGCGAALIKGGHGSGSEAIDVLAIRDAAPLRLSAPRIATRNTHGTGCTLSAAITAMLAQGLELSDAVGEAKRFLTSALEAAAHQHIGSGHGPVDHMFAIRTGK